ncbi:TonB-dependent receptor [Sphingomonas adhaesiva]|uniref:TonB-dependent receptor n=1 Tax=Sphingomonas adhaesiva TaxID=28212 RepID=UPI002FF6BA0D
MRTTTRARLYAGAAMLLATTAAATPASGQVATDPAPAAQTVPAQGTPVTPEPTPPVDPVQSGPKPAGTSTPPIASPDDGQGADIVVTGTRASLQRAVEIKREAPGVVDAISSEDLGKFPDTNIAESLQRIPGIAIDRNGGEGQFVTVRGFGPTFNQVLVNGRQVASETDGRAFSFDLYPADLIAGAEVYKSGVSHLPAGGIGATVNLKTARPLDLKGFRLIANAQGLYDVNSGKVTPELFGLVSDTTDDGRFGALLSVSYQKRRSREEFLDQNGWLPTIIGQGVNASAIVANPGNVSTIFRPRETANGIREQERERLNIQGVLQWQATDTLRLTADGFYNKFSVDSKATLLNTYIGVGANDITDITLDRNGTVLRETVNSEIGALVRLEGRPTETKLIGLNADWQVTPEFRSTLDFAYSNSRADPASRRNTGQAVLGFLSSQIAGGQRYTFDMTSGFPVTTFTPALTSAITNVDAYRLHVAQYGNQTGDGTGGANTDNGVYSASFDNSYSPSDGGFFKTFSFGVNYTRDRKRVDFIQPNFAAFCQFCGFFQDAPNALLTPIDLSDTLSGLPSGIQRRFFTFDLDQLIAYQSSPEALAARDVAKGLPPGTSAAQWERLRTTEGGYVGVRQPASFGVTETSFSGYANVSIAGTIGAVDWGIDTGARLVRTRTEATGSSSTLLALNQTTPSQYDPTLGAAALVTRSNTYYKLLPNFNLKILPSKEIIVRLAASQTFARPQLSDLAPRFAFNDLRPGSLTASGGNTALRPFTSTNLDASFEYYFNTLSFLTVAAYWKNVEDFIVTTNSVETITVPNGIRVTTGDPAINAAAGTVNFLVSRPVNAEQATVKGVEVGGQLTFDFLPGPLRFFGVSGNANFVSSNAGISTGDNINTIFALPGLGNTQNAAVFFDNGTLDARVSYSRRGSFLETLVNPKAAVEPIFVAPFQQVDFRINYNTEIGGAAMTFFVGGVNVFNEKIRKYGRYENQFITYRNTGPRYQFGVRARF